MPKWKTILRVVLPVAAAGIGTGITLAIARIIGETAPLLLIAGYTTSINNNPLEGRMATLPVFAFQSLPAARRAARSRRSTGPGPPRWCSC